MIKHIKCDIFESGADVILHQVNCQGAMNSGVAKQVREKYPEVYESYKRLCDSYNYSDKLLGRCQPICVNSELDIVNIFGQYKFGYDGKCYTDYDKLQHALCTVDLNYNRKTIAIPYLMGCHRGGGDWNVVYKLIEEAFEDNDVLICEYDGG